MRNRHRGDPMWGRWTWFLWCAVLVGYFLLLAWSYSLLLAAAGGGA